MRYNLSHQESKGSTPRAAHNLNLLELRTFQSSFYGPNYSWKNKVMERNILYQDNKSAILLEENGKKSSAGKRSEALDIHYFFLTDQVEKGCMIIKYFPTDNMDGYFYTKPLQGEKFANFATQFSDAESLRNKKGFE